MQLFYASRYSLRHLSRQVYVCRRAIPIYHFSSVFGYISSRNRLLNIRYTKRATPHRLSLPLPKNPLRTNNESIISRRRHTPIFQRPVPSIDDAVGLSRDVAKRIVRERAQVRSAVCDIFHGVDLDIYQRGSERLEGECAGVDGILRRVWVLVEGEVCADVGGVGGAGVAALDEDAVEDGGGAHAIGRYVRLGQIGVQNEII